MRGKELIIGAAPIAAVKAYTKGIQDWDDRQLMVNAGVVDEFEGVPNVSHWGTGVINLRNSNLWKIVAKTRPGKVVILTNPFNDDSNIIRTIKRMSAALLLRVEIETPYKPVRNIISGSDYPSRNAASVLPALLAKANAAFIDTIFWLGRKLGAGLGQCFAPPGVVQYDPLGRTIQYHVEEGDGAIFLHSKISLPALSRVHDSKETYVDGFKATSDNPKTNKDKPSIILIGASYLLGSFLSNEDSLGWHLQERFPGYNVIYYSKGGMTTVQQYYLLKELLQENNNVRAVVSYVSPGMDNKILKTPFPRLFPSLKITSRIQPVLPNARLDALRFAAMPEQRTPFELTCDSLKLMHSQCLKNGVDFLVAAGWACQELYPFLVGEGLPWIPCTRTPDQEAMEEHVDEWTLWPFDIHPNAKAHAVHAKGIGDYLEAMFQGRVLHSHQELLEDDALLVEGVTLDPAQDIYPLF